jgi:hypothetical protein
VDEDDPVGAQEPLHGPLGCAFTVVLVAATPASIAVGLWRLGTLAGDARLQSVLPIAAVYAWLVSMGLGQIVVVGPVALLALLRGRRACAAGMGVGAGLVAAANVGALLFLGATGGLSEVPRALGEMW